MCIIRIHSTFWVPLECAICIASCVLCCRSRLTETRVERDQYRRLVLSSNVLNKNTTNYSVAIEVYSYLVLSLFLRFLAFFFL